MGKIFEVDFRNRSMMDNVSGVVPSILGTSRFVRTPQGYALRFNGDGHLNYGVMPWAASNSDHHTFVFVLKNRGVRGAEFYKAVFGAYPPTLTEGAIDIGAGITNTPQSVRMYFRGVNNVPNKEVFTAVPVMDEDFRLVIIERNGDTAKLYADNILRDTEVGLAGIDTSTSSKPVLLGGRQLWVGDSYKGDLLFFKVYDHVFSPLERVDEYQLFRHSSPTSTANIIHHRIPVDPTGSVMCHNYQFPSWRGGIVPDLSGNNNFGTPVGFVDTSPDGACNTVTDGEITVPNSPELEIGNRDFTWACHFKGKDLTVDGALMGIGTNGVDQVRLETMCGGASTYLRIRIWDGVVHTAQDTGTKLYPLLDYYVEVVVDRDSSVTFMVNGVVSSVIAISSIGDTTSGLPFKILGGVGGGNRFLNGWMKYAKVYPYLRTIEEHRRDYNNIARLVDLNVMDKNLLPDEKVYTAGMRFEI